MRVLFVFIFGIVIAFSQVSQNETQDDKSQIFIVRTIHSEHFNPENHYSIIDLQRQISALRPDLVCGEITPEA